MLLDNPQKNKSMKIEHKHYFVKFIYISLHKQAKNYINNKESCFIFFSRVKQVKNVYLAVIFHFFFVSKDPRYWQAKMPTSY